jgi:hypothetical protein
MCIDNDDFDLLTSNKLSNIMTTIISFLLKELLFWILEPTDARIEVYCFEARVMSFSSECELER